jgi:hypothetical protein
MQYICVVCHRFSSCPSLSGLKAAEGMKSRIYPKLADEYSFTVLSLAPRHEGVLGEWRYSSTHYWPRQEMAVSAQLHALADLSPRKETLVSIG